MKKILKSVEIQICNLDLLVGVIFGFILSLSVTFMIMSGSINFHAFYDTGDYCEFDVKYVMSGAKNTKLLSSNQFEFLEDESSIRLASDAQISFYNYLNIYLSDMESESINSGVLFYNQEGNLTKSSLIQLQNGKNVITLPDENVGKVIFQFYDQKGQQLKLDKMESVEKLCGTSVGKGIALFGITFLFYVLFVMRFFLKIIKKIDSVVIQPVITGLQKIWMRTSIMLNGSAPQIPEKQRRIIRIICFLWIMLDQQYMIKYARYSNSEVYRFYIARICIVMLILAFCNIRREMKILEWNRPIIKSWVALSICMCISDFIMNKKIMYTGYWLVLVFGFFFWTWANMEHPLEILHELMIAFEITFIMACFYCFGFERLTTSYYAGTMKNSNTFGEYMAIAVAVFTGLIFEELYKKRKWHRLTMLMMELLVAVYFLWISQCRSALLATIICCVLMLLGVKKNKSQKNFFRKFLLACGVFVLLFVPVWFGTNYIITHNSGQSTVTGENTVSNWDKAANDVMAISLQDSKLLEKFKNINSIDDVTSGRISIYRTYLMKSNLWGHEGTVTLFGRNYGAHNSILMISYRYGVIAAIPYITLLVLFLLRSLYYAVSRIKEKESYSLLLINLVITVSLIGLLDNQEDPMKYLTWFLFYFLIGFFFQDGLGSENNS